jgi:hypothetical protein
VTYKESSGEVRLRKAEIMYLMGYNNNNNNNNSSLLTFRVNRQMANYKNSTKY